MESVNELFDFEGCYKNFMDMKMANEKFGKQIIELSKRIRFGKSRKLAKKLRKK